MSKRGFSMSTATVYDFYEAKADTPPGLPTHMGYLLLRHGNKINSMTAQLICESLDCLIPVVEEGGQQQELDLEGLQAEPEEAAPAPVRQVIETSTPKWLDLPARQREAIVAETLERIPNPSEAASVLGIRRDDVLKAVEVRRLREESDRLGRELTANGHPERGTLVEMSGQITKGAVCRSMVTGRLTYRNKNGAITYTGGGAYTKLTDEEVNGQWERVWVRANHTLPFPGKNYV